MRSASLWRCTDAELAPWSTATVCSCTIATATRIFPAWRTASTHAIWTTATSHGEYALHAWTSSHCALGRSFLSLYASYFYYRSFPIASMDVWFDLLIAECSPHVHAVLCLQSCWRNIVGECVCIAPLVTFLCHCVVTQMMHMLLNKTEVFSQCQFNSWSLDPLVMNMNMYVT